MIKKTIRIVIKNMAKKFKSNNRFNNPLDSQNNEVKPIKFYIIFIYSRQTQFLHYFHKYETQI